LLPSGLVAITALGISLTAAPQTPATTVAVGPAPIDPQMESDPNKTMTLTYMLR